jgi:S-DNA-T family DNA segregation ATPase FtsK/SpoIIIE
MESFLRKEQKQKDTSVRLTGWQRLKESVLIISLISAVFIFISLISYDPSDPSWSQTAWDTPINNAAGNTGALVADTLFFVLGTIAYAVPLLTVFIGWRIYRPWQEKERGGYAVFASKILGFVLLLLTSCVLADLNFDDFWYFSSGGIIGDVLMGVILPLFNLLGSTLIMLCLWAVGFTLFTGISWLTLVDKIGEYLLDWCTYLVNLVRGDQSRIFGEEKDALYQEKHHETDFLTQTHGSPLYVTNDEPLLGKPVTPTLTRGGNGIGFPENFDKNAPSSDLVLSASHVQPQSIIQRQNKQSEQNAFSSLNRSAFDKDLARDEAQNKAQIFNEENWQDNNLSGLQNIHIDDDELDDPLFMQTPQEKARKAQEAKERAQRASELDAKEPSPSINAKRLDEDNLQQDVELGFDYLGNKERDIAIGDLNGLSEFEKGDELSRLPEIEEDPFEQTLREAKQKAAGSIHPFLIRDEPDLPVPTEPLPTLDLLDLPRHTGLHVTDETLQYQARLIEARLEEYKINVTVKSVLPGPVITRFELELAPGVKVSRIMSLSKDIARSLSTTSVRVVDVIPGKPFVGLELPNAHRETVFMSEVVNSERFQGSRSPLSVVLGKDIEGEAIVTDLAKAPHMLVAGTTGSGKSVGVNVMIVSMLYKASPDEVRFIMIDPKMLELSVYEGIPHLLTEVVTDMKDASNALRWCVAEMERRYRLMSKLGVRNISGYNERVKEANDAGMPIPDPFWEGTTDMESTPPLLEKLPYIVVIVDEFADLIMVVGKKVEELISRLAQKARAAGIHLVLATQRPSVDVITGLIKANIPTRMAFTVSTKTDSRTILDQSGAESLLGMGDMLFMPNGSNYPVRVHGAFVSDDEVHRVVNNWKARGKPNYIQDITSGDQGEEGLLPNEIAKADELDALDPLFDQIVEFVCETRRASISGIQRRFKVGYNRAARIVDQLEAHGIISAPGQNSNREVLAPPPLQRD